MKSKHYIERPKKPACLEIQNVGLIVITFIVLGFFNPFFILLFFAAITTFVIFDISNFRHMPEAILYSKDNVLHYYKRNLTKIKFEDIKEVKVSYDKKDKPYIHIFYKEDNLDKELVISHDNTLEIVENINKDLKKAKK